MAAATSKRRRTMPRRRPARTWSARLRQRAARKARKIARQAVKNWREYRVVGGKLPDQRDGRTRIPDRIGATSTTSTTSTNRQTKPARSAQSAPPPRRTRTMATNLGTAAAGDLWLPEGRQIMKVGAEIAAWLPEGEQAAYQNHAQLTTLGRIFTGLGGYGLAYVETLIGLGLHRRVSDNLVQAMTGIARSGADITRADAAFVQLYGTQIEAELANVKPMRYDRAA